MLKFGKRSSAVLGDRAKIASVATSVNQLRCLLNYILDNAKNDERPHLEVTILGHKFLGLLDSGASRTILGKSGWHVIKNLGLPLNKSKTITCTVANGQKCSSAGSIELPIKLRHKVKLIEAIVIPELHHTLILGDDFWIAMGIVPDLRHGEWHFADEPKLIDSILQDRCKPLLDSSEESQLQDIIKQYKNKMGSQLGCARSVEHVIVTKSLPIKQRYYRVSPVMQKYIDEELQEMLRMDVVEKSSSPWASPIVMVKKKNSNKWRFCVDYRKLNSVTERDSYPLPLVSDTLDKLKDAKYLSSLDIKSAYWQIPVAESSRPLTAFVVPNRGLFQFKRMPFGLHNAPATWQRFIDTILGPELEPHVFVYLDDVVVVTQTFEKHLSVLNEVLKRLYEANITVSWEKCQFCRPEMRYLGYVVDARGLHVDGDKVKAMLELPKPKSVSEVRRIVGTFSWYRRFVPDFSTIIGPITALTKKNRKFEWTTECDESFRKIKECLVAAPILTCPDYSLPFTIQCDSSGFGIGAVLSQPHKNGDRVIAYLSRSLTKQERNFTTTERECLAVLWSIEKLRPYIEGVPFTVITDHYSLKWLQDMKDPSGRLARWAVRLQQFDFKIVHRKGKDHVVPDMLSRSVPMVDSVKANTNELPDKFLTNDKWYTKMLHEVERAPLKYINWRISNGKLYKYVKQKYSDLSGESDCWKQVVPKDKRRQIIGEAHDPPLAGHLGIYKTYSRIMQKYYWPKLQSDVVNYIKKCEKCITHKPDKGKPKDIMTSHPKGTRPWETISVDIMGPLPRSLKGNCYILVITDYLSKFSLVFALRRVTSSIVAKVMEENVFLIFGVPRVVICDNGVQFRGKEFRKLMGEYKCNIKYIAYYHARANPTERQNGTLKTMISIYVHENHRNWDVELPKIACALRTAKQETTKLTPYFINFGRNMILSGEDYNNDELLSEESGTQTAEVSRNKYFRKMFEDVRSRLKEAARKCCERYNLRRRYEEYMPNQVVWRRNFAISDASRYYSKKLAPKYLGPFYIHKRVSPWVYMLRKGDNEVLPGTWHIKDLRSNPNSEN